ncbi:hypothetical protein BDZ89DRAFT_1060663 [Hymenopellis radicata]|nr:hypothetical protein BDZ89DRAFT_1060663 [Hymenopellis radicata]
MAGPQTDQFLDLLIQLKKTTPAAAKSILNAQPQIAYGLIKLLVEMNAVDIEVFQRTLAEYGAQQQTQAAPAPPAPPVAPYHQPQPQQAYQAYPPRQAYPPQAQPTYPTPPVAMNPVLAALPEEQRTMILAVLAMTPEQINAMPPTERTSIMQLRATFGGK